MDKIYFELISSVLRAVGIKNRRGDRHLMPSENGQCCAAFRIPQARGTVSAGDDDPLAVERQLNRVSVSLPGQYT